MAVTRFMANEWETAPHAQKRGGGTTHFSLDTALAEERLDQEQACERSRRIVPYDRCWALTLLDQAMSRLEKRIHRAPANPGQWHQLKPHLTAERGSIAYPEIAAALGLNGRSGARVTAQSFPQAFPRSFPTNRR